MYTLMANSREATRAENEFGMGYQLVWIVAEGEAREAADETLESGLYVILDGTWAVSVDELGSIEGYYPQVALQDREETVARTLRDVLEDQGQGELPISDTRFLDLRRPVPQSVMDTYGLDILYRTHLPVGSLAPVPRIRQLANRFDGFFRLSASKNDHRITDDGAVLPGTYATTARDFDAVASGFNAVGRYALPNPVSARYVYPIVPARGDHSAVIGGTVRPAFNQSGGGVEVVFPNGLPAGSALAEPFRIPTI